MTGTGDVATVDGSAPDRAASGTAEPVTARGRRTRERLVVTAREVFEERGFNDTRMSDIAERAGVSHGTVYVYFDSKSAVLADVIAALLDEVADYLRVPDADDPAHRISEANLRYLQVHATHARMLQVVEQVATADERFARVLADFRARHVARVADAIRRLQSADRVTSELDPDITAAALSAMVEGYARHFPGYAAEDVHPTLTALWLRSLGLDGPPSRTFTTDATTPPAARHEEES